MHESGVKPSACWMEAYAPMKPACAASTSALSTLLRCGFWVQSQYDASSNRLMNEALQKPAGLTLRSTAGLPMTFPSLLKPFTAITFGAPQDLG